ncbi:MAG: cytochrome c-type biogenesis protein CcmH [Anaerolineales bacterium]
MMKKYRILLSGIGLLAILLVLASPGFAQGSDPTDDEVNAIASQLYCPVCENIPLDACGTAACEQWRGIIRDQLAQGWTEDQIKDYFVAQYGDRVLAEPPRRGFNWLVYITPVVVLIGGVVLLWLGFSKWRQAAQERPQAAPTNTAQGSPEAQDEYIRKVEKELKQRSRSSQ